MPQLDGLRAFAVFAVLVHHLLHPSLLPLGLSFIPWGAMGVRLFFVLSGFLITSLLLQARDSAEAAGSRGAAIRRFYLRRALRIFPIYYLVIVLALFFGPGDAREQIPWLASYAYNFWIAVLGWWTAYFSHFWSLCVEEQFYLLWPWVVLYAPRRHLKTIAVVMIALGPLYRALAVSLAFNNIAVYTVTFSSMDTLGMGSLLALASMGRSPTESIQKSWRTRALPLGLAAMILLQGTLLLSGPNLPHVVLFDTALALTFSCLIAAASHGMGRPGQLILGNRPIVYLGRISYGIYVYHLFMPDLLRPVFALLGADVAPRGLLEFAVSTAATVVVASLSWHFVERPLMRLKHRFAQPQTFSASGAPSPDNPRVRHLARAQGDSL